MGRHQYYLSEQEVSNFTFYGWLDWQQTFLTLTFTKISICLFLVRITSSKRIINAMHWFIVIMVVFHLIIFGLFCGFCRPLKAYWNLKVQGAVCFSKHQEMHVILAQGGMAPCVRFFNLLRAHCGLVFSIITDLILSCFPIFVLRGVKINIRTKIGLCVLMGLGVMYDDLPLFLVRCSKANHICPHD